MVRPRLDQRPTRAPGEAGQDPEPHPRVQADYNEVARLAGPEPPEQRAEALRRVIAKLPLFGAPRQVKGNVMEVVVSQLSGVRFEIRARSHSIECDQPTENGGEDRGMTPPELLLASLGSCAAYYAAEYLRARNLATTGVEVSVTAEKLKSPARLGNFSINVVSPVALDEEQRTGMLRSVHHCLVHNTLQNPPEVHVEIEAREPARA